MSNRTDKYKKVEIGKDVDLLPVMNLLGILIPTLLLSTEYIQLALLQTNIPKIGPQAQQIEKTEDTVPLSLSVRLTSKGIYVYARRELIPSTEGTNVLTDPTLFKTDVEVWKGKNVDGEDKEILRIWNDRMTGKKFIIGCLPISDEELNKKKEDMKMFYTGIRQEKDRDFNYPALLDKMIELHKENPTEKAITINAEPNIPFTAVIRVMDSSRQYVKDDGTKEFMFNSVTLGGGAV